MINLMNAPGLRDYHGKGMVWKGGKGGNNSGSGKSTTTSSNEMGKDFKRQNKEIGKDLEAAYKSGELSQVAGASDLQNEAYAAVSGTENKGLDAITAGRGTYQDMMDGTGMFDTAQIDDLENAAINKAKRARGVSNDGIASTTALGGSRSAVVSNDLDSQLTDALAQTKYEQWNRSQDNAAKGAQGMQSSGESESSVFSQNLNNIAQLGGEQRGIEQEQLDSTATGLERYITGFNAIAQNDMTQKSVTKSSNKSKGKSGGGK
jgi:hypothetical protein